MFGRCLAIRLIKCPFINEEGNYDDKRKDAYIYFHFLKTDAVGGNLIFSFKFVTDVFVATYLLIQDIFDIQDILNALLQLNHCIVSLFEKEYVKMHS